MDQRSQDTPQTAHGWATLSVWMAARVARKETGSGCTRGDIQTDRHLHLLNPSLQ